jgi:hypothetical protein
MLGSAAISVRSRKAHARLTNNLRELHGVDGRSAEGKRYRDLLDSLIMEFGAHDPIRLRELAGLKYTQELTQAAAIKGDSTACENLVRLCNLVSRRERELRAIKRVESSKPPQSLHARLAAKYGVKGNAP